MDTPAMTVVHIPQLRAGEVFMYALAAGLDPTAGVIHPGGYNVIPGGGVKVEHITIIDGGRTHILTVTGVDPAWPYAQSDSGVEPPTIERIF